MEERTIIVKQASSFSAFMRGLIIGAGVALLFAPRSGQETREILNERGSEIKDKAMDLANTTRDRAQTVIGDARNKIQDTVKTARTNVSNMAQDLSHKTPDSVTELKRELEIEEEMNNPSYNL